MSQAIIIFGPSQGGKNFFADQVIETINRLGDESVISAPYATKYTSRPLRKNDDPSVKSYPDGNFPPEVDFKEYLKEDNLHVGYSSSEILALINDGKYPVICTGTMELVRRLNYYLNVSLNKDGDTMKRNCTIVSTYGFIASEKSILAEQKVRYGDTIDASKVGELAKKRVELNRLLHKQVVETEDFFDDTVRNMYLPYHYWQKHNDKFGEHARWIGALVKMNKPLGPEDKERATKFMEFDLASIKPLTDDEITIVGG
ncbi:MAG: hypothetical protein FWC00_04410 [Firmicutes bacterium]|nr:hypothetical protein [Bacillota bacterium]